MRGRKTVLIGKFVASNVNIRKGGKKGFKINDLNFYFMESQKEGESPWTEEPGGLQSMRSQSWTRLSN